MATKKRQKARGEPDTASLEEAILAAPEKEEPWLVLSDLLQASGDPRGELITVQHALEGARGKAWAKLKTREHELLAEHSKALFGPLVKWPKLKASRVVWRRGFIQALGDGFGDKASELLAHPSARFVEHLSSVRPRASGMASLRSFLSRFDVFDLATLAEMPRLERIDAQIDASGRVASDSLRHLVVRAVDADALDIVRRAKLPALETLSFDHLEEDDVKKAVATIAAHERVRNLQICLDGSLDDADFSKLAPIASRMTALALSLLDDPSSLAKLDLSKVQSLSIQSGLGDGEVFAALPALPALRRVSLFLPSDRIRYLRAFARSSLARSISSLKVYLSKPGAALALCEGAYDALESLDVRFDDTFTGEHLRVDEFLAAKCWIRVKTLRLVSAYVASLEGTPLAQSIEVLRVRRGRAVDDVSFLPRLKRLEIEVDGLFEPSDFETLAGLPCEVALVPAFDSGIEQRAADLDT